MSGGAPIFTCQRCRWTRWKRVPGMFKNARSANGEYISFLLVPLVFTLSARLNTKLETQNYPPMTSLVQDLSDGVRLIQLMVFMMNCELFYSHIEVKAILCRK